MDIGEAILDAAPYLRELAKSNTSYLMIQCPYHGGGQERTPSLVVARDRPVWFCHGCKTSGHAFQLLRTLGVTKIQAEITLKRAGFARDGSKRDNTPLDTIQQSRKKRYDVFRGPFQLKEEILDEYRMAPRALIQSGFAKTTLRHFEVGYDSYEGRITFPLRNVFGDLVGVSGRATIDGVEPRYKIYKQELVKKGAPADYTMEEVKESILWHAHIAKPFLLRSDEPLIITEGFKACMWTWQAGYESTVALVGSYLTQNHTELISRYVSEVILFLDNNEAGWKGTRKAGARLLKRGIRVRVASYPKHDQREQPDDFFPDEIDHLLTNSTSYLHWRRRNDQDAKLVHREAQGVGEGTRSLDGRLA